MVIPKQDLFDGLPIRWAFHCWLTAPEKRWNFKAWRDYLLTFDERGYEMVPLLFKDYRFRHDVQGFLCVNNADTLAGFVRFYQKCLQDYSILLESEFN